MKMINTITIQIGENVKMKNPKQHISKIVSTHFIAINGNQIEYIVKLEIIEINFGLTTNS